MWPCVTEQVSHRDKRSSDVVSVATYTSCKVLLLKERCMCKYNSRLSGGTQFNFFLVFPGKHLGYFFYYYTEILCFLMTSHAQWL